MRKSNPKLLVFLALMVSLLLSTPIFSQSADPAQEAFDQGLAALEKGNPAQAVEKFTQALKLEPELDGAYFNRGVAYMRLKKWPEALADFGRVLEIDPENAMTYYNRGVVYSRQRQYPQAVSEYTQAMRYDRKHWQAWANRGNAFLEMGLYAEALDDYLQAARLKPGTLEIQHNLALAYLRVGDPEKALNQADKVLAKSPDYARAYYVRGEALEKLGRKPEAAAAYRQFLQMGNPNTDAGLLETALHRLKGVEGK
jgi:tetratricopeptide (TPR) repeat protein